MSYGMLFMNDSLTICTNLDSMKPSQAERIEKSPASKELLRILCNSKECLHPVYQPIINLRSRTVFGHEALIRGPVGSSLRYPMALFSVADDAGLSGELNYAALDRALEEFSNQRSSKLLFINVDVHTLSNRDSLSLCDDLLCEYKLSPDQVVFEITEHSPIDDHKQFLNYVESFRNKGIQFALDDLGTGYNGLKLWSMLRPEFVKIDKHFIFGIHNDVEKIRFLETIHALSNSLNSQIIAEGVENEEDLNILESHGIPFVQGYLFLKPQAEITEEVEHKWRSPDSSKITDAEKVGCLTHPVQSICPDVYVNEVADIFHSNHGLDFLPVVEDKVVKGIVWRRELMETLASRFGRDLYSREVIAKIMDVNPIIVDRNLPVENLSRTITESTVQRNGDAFIVAENGEYLGCGVFMDLLRYITDLKIKSAQYANPLSGLPGNVPIQKTMQEWLDKKFEFSLIYIDLDNFKAYNDHYSYEQGDSIIRSVSTLLQKYVKRSDDFLGHIGGDDFVLLVHDVSGSVNIAESIIEEFGENISLYYNQQDYENKCIKGVDRDGKEKLFSLMSISIGIVNVHSGVVEHQQRLSSIATRAKKKAKAGGGNCFFVIDVQEEYEAVRV